MSLINKMLQDLDARGSQAGSALPADVRPAAPLRRQLPVRLIAAAASVVVLGGALAAYLWIKRPAQAVPPVVAMAAPVAVPVAAPVPGPVPVAPAAPAQLPPGAQVVASSTIAQEQARKTPARVHKGDAAPAPERVVQDPTAPAEHNPPPRVVAARTVVGPAPVRTSAAERVLVAPMASPVAGGRDMNPAQRAESQYRNALAALDEGRVAAAMEGMEQALKLHPRHDAARQSLVALLIEAGRNDEAMQQLEQSLAADAAQPTLAMLLARMQIERGISGVPTLLRTLPTAGGNADYHAFLAGALQREARHREAAEQYGAALRRMPEHGVWLMGLGISLQAEKRDREALAAFQRAKASGTLTPPLLAFVERKVQQIAP